MARSGDTLGDGDHSGPLWATADRQGLAGIVGGGAHQGVQDDQPFGGHGVAYAQACPDV